MNKHYNSTNNSTNNSNSNNKNVKVIDKRIKEIDHSNQKVDNKTGQSTVGNSKKQKVYSLFVSDHKHKITVPASHSAKSANNNNNNDDDDFSNMKQYSRIGPTHNNFNSTRNSNSNSNNKNIKVLDARINLR